MAKSHRYKRSKTRSYRQVRQTLLVFGTTGLILGIGLIAVFTVRQNLRLVIVGAIYVLAASLLMGLRGVFTYLDEQSKQSRALNKIRRELP